MGTATGVAMKIFRLLTIGTVLVGVGALLDCMYSRQCRQRTDGQLDDALEGTFPASDPTATQDFAIPVNRL
jgi:hypothetical protein